MNIYEYEYIHICKEPRIIEKKVELIQLYFKTYCKTT